jgi:hypothetical protein
MSDLYKDVTRTDAANLIATVGNHVTFMVEGHIGSGKSALLGDLAQRLGATHRGVYLDMTMLDIGDLQLPGVDHESKTSVFYPNESLGLQFDAPMILMFDEFGKASPSVKNAVLPMLVERRFGMRKFHPDTIVFATTNLGAENVGDLFKAHERNRMSFLRMAKPGAKEWIDWGVSHDVAPEVLAWVHENPQCLDSFEDVEDPRVNPYIFHPKAPRTAFVTHRSLEQASHIVKCREQLGLDATTHALIGTIGQAAALDMGAFLDLGRDLPKRDQIITDPEHAPIPGSPAALVMLCVQSARWVSKDTIDAWMTYMGRFPQKEAQAMWAGFLVNMNRVGEFASCKSFTDWAIANNYLFH